MKVQCKYCAARLEVRDDLRGKRAQCPRCRAPIVLEPRSEESYSEQVEEEHKEKEKVLEDVTVIEATKKSSDTKKKSPSTTEALMDVDFSHEEFLAEVVETSTGDTDAGLEQIETLQLSYTQRKLKEKKQKAKAVPVEPDPDDEEEESRKKKRRKSKNSVIHLLAGVFDGPFWSSATEHMIFITLSLAIFGAMTGFLVGLVRSAVMASLMFNLIGVPSMLFAFFTLSYPASCFWRIVVGSASGGDDISEWPESSVGEWVFELMLVGYLAITSLFISAGIAKFRQVVVPGQATADQYWQILGSIKEVNKAPDIRKLFGKEIQPFLPKGQPILTEVESSRPVIDPGPGWWTVFGAMIFVFPIVLISSLDSSSPVMVPWSPRLWISFVKSPLAWLVVIPLITLLMAAAVVTMILGANHAPFLTFTLGSPLAAIWIIIFGRLLGRLCWYISRT